MPKARDLPFAEDSSPVGEILLEVGCWIFSAERLRSAEARGVAVGDLHNGRVSATITTRIATILRMIATPPEVITTLAALSASCLRRSRLLSSTAERRTSTGRGAILCFSVSCIPGIES
jgi:hypothetical protein